METKRSPVAEALKQFIAALQEGEGAALTSKPAMPMGAGQEDSTACAACEAGSCEDSEHMKPEDMDGLAKAYGA
jgi:hypothetical protein